MEKIPPQPLKQESAAEAPPTQEQINQFKTILHRLHEASREQMGETRLHPDHAERLREIRKPIMDWVNEIRSQLN